MKAYSVHYYLNGGYEDERMIMVAADDKYGAYDKAVYEAIPEKHGRCPYAAWVYSVTYNNGNEHLFNTCSGLPY